MNYDQNNGMNNNYNNQNYNSDFNNGYNNYPYNNNNKQPLSYHIKRFLIGFLLILIFIFLLLWLLPTKQDMQDAIIDSLNPLYDRIFAENIETMKEVAIVYYTTDRLPKKEGDTKKLTLGEMLEMKLLLEVKDKNGEMCDADESYVEITKMEKEYKLKVNLSCGDEEDYIIVYLGCYDYCLNDICEKKETTKKKATSTSKTVYKTPAKHYCAVVNGKYYDNKGKVVTKATYQKACNTKPAPTKHYCAVVNGKYYDNKGNVVSKSAYQKACKSEPTKHYCAVVNGKYYDNKGKVVTKAAYEKACKPAPTKHYCAVVNGKYYDNKGNVVSKSKYEEACFEKEDPVYKYLYEKTIHHEAEYSDWTDWSANKEYNPNNNNINWGTHEFEINEKVGYKLKKSYITDKTKPIWQEQVIQIGTYKQWACAEYEYFIDSTTNTTYTTSSGGWVYAGTYVYSTVPNSTQTVKYIFAGMSYADCGSVCDTKPKYKFKKYTRTANKTTSTSDTKESLSVVCKKTVEKDIPLYATVKQISGYGVKIKETKTYYYHKKTRTLVKKAYDEKIPAWSYSKNDETLINQGYKYTGKYEKVN